MKENKINEYLYALGRILAGLFFMLHGLGKFGIIGDGSIPGFASGFGFPLWVAFLVALVEAAGGLFILLGLFTRMAVIPSAIVMLSAYFIAHAPKALSPLANGGEKSLLFFAVFLILYVKGSGKISIDSLIRK